MRHAGLLLLALLPWPVLAGTAYKCTSASGTVSYQDHPCPRGQSQQAVTLSDDRGPPPAPPTDTDTPAVAATAAPRPLPPAPPGEPLPVLYQCIKATDGSSYLSQNGTPAPYFVPYGILGIGPSRLSATPSAPELNRGRINPNLVGNNFVQVQDQCRELSIAETCAALRDEYDTVERKLSRAFTSDQPPLEQREATLLKQLRQCNG